MSRIAVDVDAALCRALLADNDGDAARQVAATGLRQAVLPVDGAGVLALEPARAQAATSLFVSEGGKGEGAARVAAAGDLTGDSGHRCRDEEHVHGAAAVELAVLDNRRERILRPLIGVHRHDVRVAEEGERFLVRIARHGEYNARAVGVRLEALHLDTGADEEPL